MSTPARMNGLGYRIDPQALRCAIVAREGAGFGMARMQEALLAPLRIEVTVDTDWNEAVAWVGTRSA